MKAFDDRLIELEISLDGKTLKYDQGFEIVAAGVHYKNGNLGECTLRIDNILKSDRDFIVTKTSPFNLQRSLASVKLRVGRESYGTFQMVSGSMAACSSTQPPDIGLILHSMSKGDLRGFVESYSAKPTTSLLSICMDIALAAGLTLDFQAKNTKQITNYHFTGPIGKQIDNLNRLGVEAHIAAGSNTLIVTDPKTPLNMTPIQVNSNTGMVGVPEITERGVRVKMLITNEVQIGAPVVLTSKVNPAVNGEWYIYQLEFEVASRIEPFYWIMYMAKKGQGQIGFSQ